MFSLINRTVSASVLLTVLFLWIEWFVNKTTVVVSVAFKYFNSVGVVVMFVCVLVVIVWVVFVVVFVIARLAIILVSVSFFELEVRFKVKYTSIAVVLVVFFVVHVVAGKAVVLQMFTGPSLFIHPYREVFQSWKWTSIAD